MDRQRKPTAKQGSEMSDVLKHAGPNSISMLYQNPAHSLSTLNSAHSYALHTRPQPGPSCFQQPQLHQRLDPTHPPPTTSFLQPSLTHKTGLSSGPPSPSLPSVSTVSALRRVAPPPPTTLPATPRMVPSKPPPASASVVHSIFETSSSLPS